MKSQAERNRIIEDFVDACPDPSADEIAEWQKIHPDCAIDIMDVAMLMLAGSFRLGAADDHRVSDEDVALVLRTFAKGRSAGRRKDGASP